MTDAIDFEDLSTLAKIEKRLGYGNVNYSDHATDHAEEHERRMIARMLKERNKPLQGAETA